MHQPPLLDEIEWSEPISARAVPPPLDPELARQAKAEFGGVPPFMSRFAACPWAVRMMMRFRWPQFAYISHRLADLILLVVSQDSSCRYCYGNARTYLRLTGQSETRIRQLETDFQQSDLPEQHRLALEFARLVARASPRPGRAEAAALTNAGVTSQEAAEIATYATYCVLATRIATLVAVPPSPTEKLVGRWFSPMFRVVLELEGRKHRRQIPPQPLPAHAIATPPMSALFRHLDGLPLASLLYRALTESLQSKILPRRTKLLLWAVVARALQCTTCEAGCRTLIAEEGIIEDEFNEVLQRLHSRGLTPLEAKLVPIARETTRYVPAAIQAKIRGLAAEIRDEELVEFVAITALSNAMARLTVVLDCP